jgi:hypothetical protein
LPTFWNSLQPPDTASLDAKLADLTATINGEAIALEITGDSHASYNLQGEVIITKEGDHRPGARMVCILKSGKMFIAALVHTDTTSAYLRRLKPGDRMQAQRWKAVKSLAWTVATYRA